MFKICLYISITSVLKMELSQNREKPLFNCLNDENIFDLIQRRVPHELESSF
ncbi:hypothetical protein BN165_1730005 [Clostridioides difficile E1]|nr:hypothetical protein BN163_1800005 [Clostridioides difficile T5]CCK91996.1 hypothetical protein BN164_1680005 [Clostridioides difficile T20]CCK95710.1 hypothetical protein BN165_1730005 [Clostridioides difficile E1]CCK99674.1 hypothetical protein BN166_2230009 [Clostridioides difficile E10]